MDRAAEFGVKLKRMHEYLDKKKADALALQRSDNFAWATCGGSDHVNTATDYGVATLIVTRKDCALVTNRIEAGRLRDEELGGPPIEIIALEWADNRDAYIAKKFGGEKILADYPLAGSAALTDDFINLQMTLTESEIERYRTVGADTASALETAAKSLAPGMTENDAAGRLAAECYSSGVVPIVVLIAADGRLLKYRHPLPTSNKIEKTVMLVVCGRRNGLIASATRVVSFGAVSGDLAGRHAACARVDTTFNALTRPGAKIADVFRAATDCYRGEGFDGEWLLHHQGGPTGYRPRYFTANGNTPGEVQAGAAFAWNPSITGTKTEDTIIVAGSENIFITHTGRWPYTYIAVGGKLFPRPAILAL